MKSEFTINGRSLIFIALVLMALSMALIIRSNASLSSFSKLDGEIAFLDNYRPNDKSQKRWSKNRYLKLRNHDKLILLHVGTDWGDFSPRLDRLNTLAPGDSITLYYDNSWLARGQQEIKTTQVIYRRDETVYIKSASDQYVGWLIFFGSDLLILYGVFLWWKEKKESGI